MTSHRKNDGCTTPRHCEGSALIVGLIMMLLMTLLAVAGMRTTIMQERMAGNLYDRNLAFQANESALREGEQWLEDNPVSALAGQKPLIDLISEDSLRYWNGSQATDTVPSIVSGDGLDLAEPPVFHVAPPQLKRVGVETNMPQHVERFPVTARGVGGTDESVVITQTIYQPR